MNRKLYGSYIVSDPEICHDKPTFRGTRIMVADVLEKIADGLDWETIKEINSLLHGLRRPTFFTRDDDFYNLNLCHSRYCLVYLPVRKDEAAVF